MEDKTNVTTGDSRWMVQVYDRFGNYLATHADKKTEDIVIRNAQSLSCNLCVAFVYFYNHGTPWIAQLVCAYVNGKRVDNRITECEEKYLASLR